MNQIQTTPIQQIDIKTEHQTQQKQTIQVVQRPSLPPQNANQQFIAQSLPPNNNSNNNNNLNVNISINSANVNIDQMVSSGSGVGANAGGTVVDDNLSGAGPNAQSTSYNQKTYERMRQDEGMQSFTMQTFTALHANTMFLLMDLIFLHLVLDRLATISAVLYANTNHPELKTEYPNWNERCKQILKKWRALSTEKKAPYLQKARENRSCMKKAAQVSVNLAFILLSLCVYHMKNPF